MQDTLLDAVPWNDTPIKALGEPLDRLTYNDENWALSKDWEPISKRVLKFPKVANVLVLLK